MLFFTLRIMLETNVEFISFFRLLVTVTKKRKNQPSFSGKMRISYTEHKQTGQLIFSFLVTLTKKRKMEWTGHKVGLPRLWSFNLLRHLSSVHHSQNYFNPASRGRTALTRILYNKLVHAVCYEKTHLCKYCHLAHRLRFVLLCVDLLLLSLIFCGKVSFFKRFNQK